MGRKNDMERITSELAKLGGPSTEYTGTQKPNPQRYAAKTLIRRTLSFPMVAISAGGTLARTASTSQFEAKCDGRVLGAKFIPSAAATASDAATQTINVTKNATVMASLTVNIAAGNLVAGTPKALTLSATRANQRFVKGDVIGPAVAAVGAGLAIAAGTLQVEIELEGPIDDFSV